MPRKPAPPAAVTHDDAPVEACLARLEELLATPPLTVRVEGGGVVEPFTFSPEGAVLVHRGELENLITSLRRSLS